MYIETWRWRAVVCSLGIGLLLTGTYGLVHFRDVPLNICYVPGSPVFVCLNVVASILAWLSAMALGGGLLWAAVYSALKSLQMKEDATPLDWPGIGRTALAYLIMLVLIVLVAFAFQWFLKGTTLDPRPAAEPPSENR